jgi:hypothetical protein
VTSRAERTTSPPRNQTRGPRRPRNTTPTHRGWASSATMRSRTSPSRTNPVEVERWRRDLAVRGAGVVRLACSDGARGRAVGVVVRRFVCQGPGAAAACPAPVRWAGGDGARPPAAGPPSRPYSPASQWGPAPMVAARRAIFLLHLRSELGRGPGVTLGSAGGGPPLPLRPSAIARAPLSDRSGSDRLLSRLMGSEGGVQGPTG